MSVDKVQIGDSVVPEEAAAKDETSDTLTIHSFKDVKKDLKWQQLQTKNSFTERVGHALVFSKKAKTVYMLGGGNHEGHINEIWMLQLDNTGELSWTLHKAVADFDGRYEFACALNKEEDKIWLFGGADFQLPRNDVCYLDLVNETFITKFPVNRELPLQTRIEDDTQDYSIPYPRTQGGNTCMLELDGNTYMVIYGGGVKGEQAVADGHLYLYDINAGEWQRVLVTGDTPGIRQGHVMWTHGTKIFVYGGMHEFSIFDDLYSIDMAEFKKKSPSWAKLSSEVHPCGRAAQSVAKDGSDVYIFGGLCDEGAISDLWKLNLESLEWTEIVVEKFASPRLDAAMTLIELEGSNTDETGNSKKILLVHGGMNTEGQLYNDFWFLVV